MGIKHMMIHNGDHAEFEIEHANTPKEERPDWPLPSFDARDWARAFCKQFPTFDEGTALAWFAAALMRGFDEGTGHAQGQTEEFIGWLSGDIPELHKVEVPRLADSWERFKRAPRSPVERSDAQ
jgi:hypothetical protein